VIQEDPALVKDVKIIGICLGGDKALLDAFKKTSKAAFPIFLDDKLEIAAATDISETPTLVMVSHSGKILASHGGETKDFDGLLKELRTVTKTQ
jgi:hypothetical protein